MWSSLFEQQQHRPTAILDEAAVQQLQGTISGFILDCVEYMDTQWGAAEWTTRQVAVGTVIVLGMIRAMCHEAYGVNWYSLVHAAVTGYGSAMAVWLSVFAAVPLTGTAEPLRSIVGCGGPLTSLHRIVPAITMGYGIFDILDGVGHGLDFLLHGVATFAVMAYFCEYDLAEVITPMLLMEISTPHLSLAKSTTLFSDTGSAINLGLFTLTFFLFRLIICPILWWEIMTVTWEIEELRRNNDENNNHHDGSYSSSSSCIPWHFQYVVFGFGMTFHCLNSFWGYKIIQKVIRKVKGIEKVKEKNHLKHR